MAKAIVSDNLYRECHHIEITSDRGDSWYPVLVERLCGMSESLNAAVRAADWCEYAALGETYSTEHFTIRITGDTE